MLFQSTIPTHTVPHAWPTSQPVAAPPSTQLMLFPSAVQVSNKRKGISVSELLEIAL